MSNTRNRMLLLMGLIILYLMLANLPNVAGLSAEGQRALALMVVGTIALVSEVFPMLITAILLVVLQPALKIVILPQAVANFAQPVLFFVIGGFIAATAFQTTGFSLRIAYKLASLSKGSPKRLLFYLLVGAALLSAVFADMVVVIMMMPVCLMLLRQNDCEKGKSNFGKTLMIGIPIAALIGGMGTPAGAAPNAIAIGLLAQTADVHISFAQWTIIAMPIVLIMVPIAYQALIKAYPLEITALKGMDEIEQSLSDMGPVTVKEKKFLLTFGLMVIGWLTEPIHGLGIPIVSCIGAALMFFPFNDVLTWKETQKNVAYDTIISIFCINSLGMAIWKTGAAEWTATGLSGFLSGMQPITILIIIGLFTVFIHLLVPVNSALVSIIIPIATMLALNLGINPAFIALPVAFIVSCACLIPLDAVPLAGYWTGYYKMHEMLKPGIVVSLAWVGVVVAIMMTLGRALGFI